jgi:hypothetical protein
MHLANDFEFKPLPPIPLTDDADASDDGAPGFRAADAESVAAPNPLGRLAPLLGKWSGTGFNVIWRPNHTSGQDRFLELNVTSEALEFENIKGPIPNRGLLQGDINMFGLTYLQQISDSNLKAGLHIEPGIWAHVPKTTNPAEGVTVVRMASIPHGTTILAQGVSTNLPGPPVIPKVSIKPFGIGSPTSTFDFEEQTLTNATRFRTPAAGLVGVTQAMVNDPNSVLRAAIAHQTIKSTIALKVSTSHKPIPGGGTANTAFLAGSSGGPNAVAATVTSTFWIQIVAGTPDFRQLQYSQTVLLNFNGISWPHITVATLRRVPATPAA